MRAERCGKVACCPLAVSVWLLPREAWYQTRKREHARSCDPALLLIDAGIQLQNCQDLFFCGGLLAGGKTTRDFLRTGEVELCKGWFVIGFPNAIAACRASQARCLTDTKVERQPRTQDNPFAPCATANTSEEVNKLLNIPQDVCTLLRSTACNTSLRIKPHGRNETRCATGP